MTVTVFPCGAAVNESEVSAIEHLKSQLQNIGGTDEWILLTNLAFSVTHQFQSDEIDVIAIGPPGVRVIEVKHWSVADIRRRMFSNDLFESLTQTLVGVPNAPDENGTVQL